MKTEVPLVETSESIKTAAVEQQIPSKKNVIKEEINV